MERVKSNSQSVENSVGIGFKIIIIISTPEKFKKEYTLAIKSSFKLYSSGTLYIAVGL